MRQLWEYLTLIQYYATESTDPEIVAHGPALDTEWPVTATINDALRDRGNDGWELVGVTNDDSVITPRRREFSNVGTPV